MTTPQNRGRYPGYDVLAQQDHWDPVTRRLVLARVHDVPPIRFFTDDELPVVRAFCDDVLAQDAEPRVPVVEMVDAKLYERRFDGYRHAGMPDDGEVWRILARELGKLDFAHLPRERRHAIIDGIARGEGDWGIDVGQAWSVVMRIAMEAFYSHPWAWNEIGFPGPAYPRGYSRLGVGMSEAWEPHTELS
jgi:hypothetical protein